MVMEANKATVVLAYRHLYQHLLRAVQYSKPSRYVVRDKLRAAFRQSARQDFQPGEIQRTLEFLDGAARHRGVEHRILKNLIFVNWTTGPRGDMPRARKEDRELRDSTFKAFNETVRKLNETMGLCIK